MTRLYPLVLVASLAVHNPFALGESQFIIPEVGLHLSHSHEHDCFYLKHCSLLSNRISRLVLKSTPRSLDGDNGSSGVMCQRSGRKTSGQVPMDEIASA